jgi:hypothetical protein
MYEFIESKLAEYPIEMKCRVLGVTKQGYYQWKKAKDKPYKYAGLLAMIKAILAEHPENADNYGANRVLLRLKQPKYGWAGSYSTVYRVMKATGLLQKKKRAPKGLTKADSEAQKM